AGAEFGEWWRGGLDGGEELLLSFTISAGTLMALLAASPCEAAVHGAASLTARSVTRTFEVSGVFVAAPDRLSYRLSLSGGPSPIGLQASRTVPAAIAADLVERATSLSVTLLGAGAA